MYGYYYPHTKLAFDVGQFAKKYWLPLSAGGGALAGGIAGGLIDKEKPARGITIGALGGGLAGPAITYGGMKLYDLLSSGAADAVADLPKGLRPAGDFSGPGKLRAWRKRSLREITRAMQKGLISPAEARAQVRAVEAKFKELLPKAEKARADRIGRMRHAEILKEMNRNAARRARSLKGGGPMPKASWFYPYEPSNLEKLAEVQDNVELFIKVAEEEGIDLSYMDPEELVYRAQIFADALEEDDYYWAEKEAEAELLGEVYGEAAEEAFLSKLAEVGLI